MCLCNLSVLLSVGNSHPHTAHNDQGCDKMTLDSLNRHFDLMRPNLKSHLAVISACRGFHKFQRLFWHFRVKIRFICSFFALTDRFGGLVSELSGIFALCALIVNYR